MENTLTDSLILDTLQNAFDIPQERRMNHADYLRNLQELCPDKELSWILQHPADVFPKIPEQHADTVSAVLEKKKQTCPVLK